MFRGKTLLLPCDDPEWSNFTKFFAQNFESFGLKKLISTSYAVESKKIKDWLPTLFETDSPTMMRTRVALMKKTSCSTRTSTTTDGSISTTCIGTTLKAMVTSVVIRPSVQRHAVQSRNGLHLLGYLQVALHVLRKVARVHWRLLRCGNFPHLALRHFLVESVEKCHNPSLLKLHRQSYDK